MKELHKGQNLIMLRLEVLIIGQKLQNTENKEVNISKTQLKN